MDFEGPLLLAALFSSSSEEVEDEEEVESERRENTLGALSWDGSLCNRRATSDEYNYKHDISVALIIMNITRCYSDEKLGYIVTDCRMPLTRFIH